MKVIPIKGIVGLDVTVESMKPLMDQVTPTDEVTFDISSPGGSVITGFEIYNEIKNLKAVKKIAQVNGISASIASIIMMAADEIEASEVSLLMIHKASGGGEGNSDQLAQQIEILNMIDQLLVDTYSARNKKQGKKKLSEKEVWDLVTAETWMTPADALEYGFIDRVINKVTDLSKIAAQYNPKTKDMNHLLKLKRLLAQGGRIEITKDDVNEAVTKALEGGKYSALDDEGQNKFLAAVKALLEEKVGGTLTDQEQEAVNAFLNESVNALKEVENSQTSEGQINELKKSINELTNLVKTLADTTVNNGQAVENLAFELTAMKKQARTFGKKPFLNESTKMLNIGSAYVDPYAKHRKEMEEIDHKTRATKA